jgi:hypothetical protein
MESFPNNLEFLLTLFASRVSQNGAIALVYLLVELQIDRATSRTPHVVDDDEGERL